MVEEMEVIANAPSKKGPPSISASSWRTLPSELLQQSSNTDFVRLGRPNRIPPTHRPWFDPGSKPSVTEQTLYETKGELAPIKKETKGEKTQQATHTASLHVAWKALHGHVGGCARGAPIGTVDEDLVRWVQAAPATALGARGVQYHGVAIDR